MKSKITFSSVFLLVLSAIPVGAYAQDNATSGNESVIANLLSNGAFVIMLCTAVLLLFVIVGMAEVVKAGAAHQRNKMKSDRDKNAGKIAATILFLMASSVLWAQDAAAAPTEQTEPWFDYWGMGATAFFVMLGFIAMELLMIYLLYRSGMMLLDREELKEEQRILAKDEPSFMEKFNASVAVHEEAAIMMDHEYDGIRELDNNLPPWWKYGFYVSIVWAVIYLAHFHVLETGKLQADEYNEEVKRGEEQVAEYKKKAADMVDENTITLMSNPADISAGALLFKENCVVCHGENGVGGQVGPNLADAYWLHGGSLADVFKSIKYGWTEKGMKAWGQELSPKQMAQLSSYIKTLPVVNPPAGKAPEGVLYSENGAAAPMADSVPVTDSLPAADSVKK